MTFNKRYVLTQCNILAVLLEKICENYILSLNMGLPTVKANVSLESSAQSTVSRLERFGDSGWRLSSSGAQYN